MPIADLSAGEAEPDRRHESECQQCVSIAKTNVRDGAVFPDVGRRHEVNS
jgi:hypothetical protein